MANAERVGPFAKRLGFAIQCYQVIVALVAVLLSAGRPAAITRLVALAVVIPLYGVLVARALSHVGQEHLETVGPSLTDRYPTAAVGRVGLVIPIEASAFDASPHFVFGRLGQAMRAVVPAGNFASVATAAPRPTAGEIAGEDGAFGAAFAAAQPVALADVFDHGPSADLLSGQVLDIPMAGTF